jgi:hypothetical protein
MGYTEIKRGHSFQVSDCQQSAQNLAVASYNPVWTLRSPGHMSETPTATPPVFMDARFLGENVS